ncbi:MAG: hypothetical protein ING84_04855 [Cytophagales bacterium]|jgi:hypothetical protein|nr:hypothetical protein [Cytophagales bacterium]MCA6367201.1 hypothetical protein [Cytophagales bacterium]MCA6373242.1 hypothetical protein [Cytophagales bacterium]MCA6374196.1 hypothetical protein [Cytophagales bacterium]MCA6381923.1 hypothetical protein [Cytophagales bacterium]
MKVYIHIFSFLLISALANAQKATQFSWLVGTWKMNAGSGYVIEQWKQLNDSTFRGKSLFVKAPGDSMLQESIELSFRKGEWSYNPTVVDQNNRQPVKFQVIFIGKGEFICENPVHDFPQRIAYRRIKNSLFASIEGTRNGKYSKVNFDFLIE